MAHDAALEAHEQHERAEEAVHAHDPFVSRVSITIAVLALFAATTSSLENLEAGAAITSSSEAVLAQDKATDAWGEYQADSLKRHIYGIAADQGGSNAGRYRDTSAKEQASQKQIQAEAKADEGERDKLLKVSRTHEGRHHWLTGAATLLEIAIAICTVAIITRRRLFWISSIGLGLMGLVLFAGAYLA
ncbi:MAG TPA: DUF4337 family protein [Caulobacteraceae bacterium]|jgi:hypothetical protein|nr:DUF4337 family protein [Caulobacteraceae bacterium]